MLFDGIQNYFRSQKVRDQLLQDLQGLAFMGSTKTGAVDKYHGAVRDIHVTIYETQPPGVKLNGSIQKFEKGNNVVRYSRLDLKKAIMHYCGIFKVDPNERTIQRIEFGINIVCRCPEAIIRSAMLYRGRTAKRDPNSDCFSKRWEFDQYVVKLYKKGQHLLRFEIKIKDMRKIRNLDLGCLSNLCDCDHFVRTLYYLYESVDKFLFVPCDKEHRLQGIDEVEWNSFRSESYWEELNKDIKYRRSRKVCRLVKTHNLIDWKDYLKREILYEGCMMLGQSLPSLLATFSCLGLQDETVAGPNRNRDRQTEIVSLLDFVIILRHQVLRSICYRMGVNISVISYSLCRPRAPPFPSENAHGGICIR